jgi:hypothetical protein
LLQHAGCFGRRRVRSLPADLDGVRFAHLSSGFFSSFFSSFFSPDFSPFSDLSDLSGRFLHDFSPASAPGGRLRHQHRQPASKQRQFPSKLPWTHELPDKPRSASYATLGINLSASLITAGPQLV